MWHDPNPWITYRRPRPRPRLQLFCFPHAGGGASAFRAWQESLPAEIEVGPVNLFVPARRAPQFPPEDPLHGLPSDEFRARVAELEGTPAGVLKHPELMDLLESLPRADFEVNDTYETERRITLAPASD